MAWAALPVGMGWSLCSALQLVFYTAWSMGSAECIVAEQRRGDMCSDGGESGGVEDAYGRRLAVVSRHQPLLCALWTRVGWVRKPAKADSR